jgi:hypothetical protein|tara:strand:- start:175 stop:405 length:231 start_codon:yes stop_codon:yes gene_type:complete
MNNIKIGDIVYRENKSGIVVKHGVKMITDVKIGDHSESVVQVSGPFGLLWWPVSECNVLKVKDEGDVNELSKQRDD